MNQTFALPAGRLEGDSPAMLYIVRRFAWLILAGTLAGMTAGGGLYAYMRAHHPRYRSRVQFQVLPPQPPLGAADGAAPIVFNNDDTMQFIHRQVLRIRQERILEQIIQSREFQTDHAAPDDASRRSRWLTENWNNPVAALLRDLQVTPIVESGAFELSMTAGDPYEAYAMVNAAQRIYLDDLRADSRQVTAQRLESLGRVRQDQERTVRNLADGLNQYQAALNLPALTARYKLELDSLTALNARIVEAEGLASAARRQLDDYTRQAAAPPAAALSADVQQFIDDDFGMRTLQAQKMAIEQERAAILARANNSPVETRMLEARAAKIDDQIEALTRDLSRRALAALRERASNALATLDAQLDYMRKTRKEKEAEVGTLDASLIQYQQKVEELKAQEELLERLRRQDTLQALGGGTDDTRVQRIVDAALPGPGDFVAPALRVYLPAGTLGGCAASFLLAYLLVLTDTRVRTPRDVTRTLQQPLLGFVPHEREDRFLDLPKRGPGGAPAARGATALVDAPRSLVAESFRRIRSHLFAHADKAPVRTLLVASLSPGGGATTVAANLAAGLALNERRVLLVDANFHRPALRTLFPEIPAAGFADLLADPALLPEAIVPAAAVPRLHLLGAGGTRGRSGGAAVEGGKEGAEGGAGGGEGERAKGQVGAAQLLEGAAFRRLLEQFQSRYDVIVFDGAPLALVADSLTLASRVDGLIPVIRAGKVSCGTVLRIRDQLRMVHANLLGFVLNAAKSSTGGYFKESYRNFYRYAGHRHSKF